ncbi:MAG: SRPBCC family protein [Dehalococcoidia bacterium]
MRTHRVAYEQLLPLDLETTFAFFADAGNLERLTPPWLKFRILSQLPIVMRRGAQIDYRLKLRGIPIDWQSEITAWEPPFRFVDEQRRGPYRLWHHTHTFEAVGENATLVRDEIVYAVPGGAVVDLVAVRPDIERIFRFRREELQRWAVELLRHRAIH